MNGRAFFIYLSTFIRIPGGFFSLRLLTVWFLDYLFWQVFDSHLYYSLFYLTASLCRAAYLLGSNFLNGTCLLFSLVNTEVNKSFNCLRMHFCFSSNGIPASGKSFPLSASPYLWFSVHLWTHMFYMLLFLFANFLQCTFFSSCIKKS